MITWREVVCKCKCGHTLTTSFFNALNDLREGFGKPIIVLSGARCAEHNRSVGGAKQSAHLDGRAADLHKTDELLAFCTVENLEKYGLYMEDPHYTTDWIHLTDRAPASGKRIFKP